MRSSTMKKTASVPPGAAHVLPLSPPAVYRSRVGRCALVALVMMGVTLAVGTLGYRYIDGFAWLDAFHQSAMLLAGMGSVKDVTSAPGKLFDSAYALACALVMLGAAGFLFAPVIHRVLHRYHLEDADAGQR